MNLRALLGGGRGWVRNRPRQAQGWRWAKKTGEKGSGRKVRAAGGRRKEKGSAAGAGVGR